MDLIDIIAIKGFLGREFLTWLFYKSETTSTFVIGGEQISVAFGPKAILEAGSGDHVEKVSCSGKDMPEVIKALSLGKQFESAAIVMEISGLEYRFTLQASLFDFQGVKLPKVATPSNDDDKEGWILERIYLFQKMLDAFEGLFLIFMKIRADKIVWTDEMLAIRNWIRETNHIS